MKVNRINFKNQDNSKIFFTADPHFGHDMMRTKVRKARNLATVGDMNCLLIENWNNTVPKDGHVFLLGDVSWYRKPEEIKKIFKSLNGTIYLIRGNHDESLTEELIKSIPNVKSIQTYAELMVRIEDDSYEIVLSHFPFEIWDRKHYGACHLHGHCHGTLPFNDQIRRLDVGVDNHKDLRPFTFAEIVNTMGGVDLETFTK